MGMEIIEIIDTALLPGGSDEQGNEFLCLDHLYENGEDIDATQRVQTTYADGTHGYYGVCDEHAEEVGQ